MKSRFVFLFLFFSFVWLLFFIRLGQIQLWPNPRLAQKYERQFNKKIVINPRRGLIFDRKGNELAASVPAYSVYADPFLIKDPYSMAKKLSTVLNVSWRRIYSKIKNKNKRFVWLKRRAESEIKTKIDKINSRGISYIQESKRVYPNGKLLSQVLGFVGNSNNGLEGLERTFDDILLSEKKKIEIRRDARGRALLQNGKVFVNSHQGSNLFLTIDSDLQFQLENELKNAVDEFEAKSAVGIVLNAKTSEVLAMANIPSFDPNNALAFPLSIRKNRAITDSFEPGSTVKTLTMAAALENKTVKPNTIINGHNGKLKIGRHTISEAEKSHYFEKLTATEILTYSSNVGISEIAFQLGQDKLYKTFKKFSLGEQLGIEFSGESRGILAKPPWRKLHFSNISFGHGLTMTPIQLAAAYATIASDGILRRPYIIKKIEDEESKDSQEFKPFEIRRVISKQTAKTLKFMLSTVTSEKGTGKTARILGYPVAGKTGTAQKVNPNGRGYLFGGYISSFAGFVPANDPEFVIVIAIESPQKSYYASTVAAPVFAKVGAYALLSYGIPPVYVSEKHILSSQSNEVKSNGIVINKFLLKNKKMPTLIGLSLREVLQNLDGQPYSIKVKGFGRVYKTEPIAGKELKQNQKLRVFLK